VDSGPPTDASSATGGALGRLAEVLGDEEVRMNALTTRGAVLRYIGESQRAVEYLERNIELTRHLGLAPTCTITTFGHGAGRQMVGFADPEYRFALGVVKNRMRWSEGTTYRIAHEVRVALGIPESG
jgi:hypothetical protein